MELDFDTLYIAGAVTLIGAYYMLNNLTIKIDRYILTDTRTIGKMYLNGQYFCDTLEDTYRGQDLKDSKVFPLSNFSETNEIRWKDNSLFLFSK